jgi:hypothetical protein
MSTKKAGLHECRGGEEAGSSHPALLVTRLKRAMPDPWIA